MCQTCGCKYSVEEAKKMMVEVSGQISIDDSGKLSTYIQMADSAYRASNWQEAYNYYSKAQEVDVNNYHSIYRRGLSYGWQGNLMDFRAQEVVGGIVNAKKAMVRTNDDPHKKAFEVANMMSDMANWVGALASASIKGGYERITSSPTAAQNFYDRMCIISELFIFAADILDENSYANLTPAERRDVKNNAKEISDLTSTIANMMQSATSLKVSDGIRYNSFWQTFEDSYKRVNASSSVSEEGRNLAVASNKLKNQFSTWDRNITTREAEEKERKLKEKREVFFKDNPDIYKEYTEKIELQKKLKAQKDEAEKRVSSLESDLKSVDNKISQHQSSIDSDNAEISKLQKKIFGKKKAEEEISKKKAHIEQLKGEIQKLDYPKKKSEADVNAAKQVLSGISSQLKVVEGALNNILKVNGLES